MKKEILLYSLILMSACNTIPPQTDFLNKTLVGKKLYLCYDTETVEKTVKRVEYIGKGFTGAAPEGFISSAEGVWPTEDYIIYTEDTMFTSQGTSSTVEGSYNFSKFNYGNMNEDAYLKEISKFFQRQSGAFCSQQEYIAKKDQIQQALITKQKQEQQAALKQQQDDTDCHQAKTKATQRFNDIKSSLGLAADSTNITASLNGKVVDFAANGVIISNDCSSVWNNAWLFGKLGYLVASNCKEQRIFVYTDDTDYATGEAFKNRGLIYQRVGNYKYTTVAGSLYSVPAYKATKYQSKEVNYKTYLQNKGAYCR